ncbi:hypothetical protein VTN00DRAFT_465 [Thermoascus crustaceus]|uniref:uncharacterized protein n=1 Tax=Thermoascus crustaceus TaxID=5088 RepID=UPI0037433FE4
MVTTTSSRDQEAHIATRHDYDHDLELSILPIQEAHVHEDPSSCQIPTTIAAEEPDAEPTNEAIVVAQSITNPPINKYRLLTVSLLNFLGGLNDSAPGPLIPYIERHYSVNYATVSTIFVANAIGFLAAAPCTNLLERRLGRAWTYVLAELSLAAAYIALACSPPFPVIVIAFLPIGFGLATALSLSNVFCANLSNGTAALGILHGSYGIGGTLGPLMATGIASRTGGRWSLFYFLPLGMALLNTVLAGWTFRGFENDIEMSPPVASRSSSSPEESFSHAKLLRGAFKNRVTLLGALFIFAYQGAEVSISGWIVSFLITSRHGDVSSVGYVSAGFWAGITVGRFLLSHPAHTIGEKVFVIIAIAGAVGFQLIVWLVPNMVGEAVAVAIVGLLLGPIFPCAAAVFSKLLPRNIQMSSLGFITASGSSGGAVAPFVTGLLAQKAGTFVLHPICIGLFVAMEGCWGILPRLKKRTI